VPICPKCGQEVNLNAKYCDNCGTKLDSEDDAESAIRKTTVKEDVGKLVNVIKDMIVAPISTIKSKESDFSPVVLAVILAILQGLMVICLANITTNTLMSFFGINWMMGYLSQSYGKIFVYVFLAVLLGMLLLALCIYLVGQYAFHGKRNELQQIGNVVIKAEVPVTIALLVSLLLMFINSTLSIAFFLIFGTLLSVMCVYEGVQKVMELSADYTAYTVAISYLIIFFIIMFFLKSLLV
jgi:hypothetical protein